MPKKPEIQEVTPKPPKGGTFSTYDEEMSNDLIRSGQYFLLTVTDRGKLFLKRTG